MLARAELAHDALASGRAQSFRQRLVRDQTLERTREARDVAAWIAGL